jgi:hypothetical protein
MQRAFILALALAIGIIAVRPCHAEQPVSEAERYLAKYAEMVKTLQEVKFDFTGSSTRSTATEGLAGAWKNKGTIHVSESLKSFHSVTNATLAMAGEPPTDLGISELLVTPAEIRDVSISNDGRALPNDNGFTVNLNTKPRGDEWAEQVANSEFGILFGLAPIGDQGAMSLLTASRTANLESVQDSKGLRGLKAKGKDATIQVLFDPSDNDRLAQVLVSRSADGLGVDDVTRATLTIEDIQFVNSKPSMMTVHIKIELCGGELAAADRPANVVERPTKIEPQTWDYSYEISGMQYVAADRTPVFIPVQTIPDGTTDVTVDGNRPYVWQSGKPVKVPNDFERTLQSKLPSIPGLPTR